MYNKENNLITLLPTYNSTISPLPISPLFALSFRPVIFFWLIRVGGFSGLGFHVWVSEVLDYTFFFSFFFFLLPLRSLLLLEVFLSLSMCSDGSNLEVPR